MSLTGTLNRYSAFGFVLFLALTLFAFWPTYFTRLTALPTYHLHLHGLAMLAWLALLVTQGFLIRGGRRPLHKQLGKLSYLLAPLVVAVTIHALHFRLQGIPPSRLPPGAFYFTALVFNALVAFVVLYGLAIRHRHTPAVHARYMIGTVFPLVTPVTDRIIGVHLPALAAQMPQLAGTTVLPVAGFVLVDAILLALVILDWRSKDRARVFPVVLAVVLAYHVSVLTFHAWPPWQAFCRWFVQLPLS